MKIGSNIKILIHYKYSKTVIFGVLQTHALLKINSQCQLWLFLLHDLNHFCSILFRRNYLSTSLYIHGSSYLLYKLLRSFTRLSLKSHSGLDRYSTPIYLLRLYKHGQGGFGPAWSWARKTRNQHTSQQYRLPKSTLCLQAKEATSCLLLNDI
jgi:hypothetical protein